MTIISLVATDQLLSIALQPKVASGDINSVKLHVDFDSIWDKYAKNAVFFTADDDTVYEILLNSGNCVVPPEVLVKPGILYIGIRGVNADNNAVKTSTLVKYKISEGAPSGNGTTVEPTADVYQQLLTAYGKTAEEIAVERARINQLVANGNESGNEGTELADIRVDVLGRTHETAGEAVRYQIKHINVEPQNTSFFEWKNLFNPDDVGYRSRVRGTSGAVVSAPTYQVSNYIPVRPNTDYICSPADDTFSYAIYDSSCRYLSGADGVMGFTTPADAAFIRVSWENAQEKQCQVEEGTEATEYVPYGKTYIKPEYVKSQENPSTSRFEKAMGRVEDGDICGIPIVENLSDTGEYGVMSIQRTPDEEKKPGFVSVPSVGMVEDMLSDYPTNDDVQDHINNASMKAKYNVSASAADNVYLTIVSNGDLTYTAKLSGEGSTRDYTKNDVKPWDVHIANITAIEIGSGVTSIGANLFREHQEVRALRFENIANIRHVGARAFMRCRFGGEFNFSGLEDTTLDTAFYGCSEMEGLSVPSTITTVAPFALTACFSLKYVRGLANVKTIGDGAFAWCTSLVSTDISPEKVESVAVAAFSSCPALNGTSAAEWVKLNNVPLLTVPALNWTDETLAEIRAVKLPNAPTREMFPDDQTNYPNIPYCLELNGSQRYMGSGGCSAITFYNIYNHFNRAQFINAEEWWNGVILAQDPDIATTYYYPNYGLESIETSVFLRMASIMEWEPYWTEDYDVDISTDGNEFDRQDANFQRIAGYYTPAQFKQFIAEALSKGIPVAVGCKPDGASGHMVAVIGSDPETDQLIVCDSMHYSGTQGRIYKVAFENLIQNDGWASLSAWMPIGYVADEPTDPDGDIPMGGGSDKWEFIGEFNVGDEDVSEWWITEDAEGNPIKLKEACYTAYFQPSSTTTSNTNVIFGNPIVNNPFQSNNLFFKRPWLTKGKIGGEVHVKCVPITAGSFAVIAWLQTAVATIAWSAGKNIEREAYLAGLAMKTENAETGLIGAGSTVAIWGVRM